MTITHDLRKSSFGVEGPWRCVEGYLKESPLCGVAAEKHHFSLRVEEEDPFVPRSHIRLVWIQKRSCQEANKNMSTRHNTVGAMQFPPLGFFFQSLLTMILFPMLSEFQSKPQPSLKAFITTS